MKLRSMRLSPSRLALQRAVQIARDSKRLAGDEPEALIRFRERDLEGYRGHPGRQPKAADTLPDTMPEGDYPD